ARHDEVVLVQSLDLLSAQGDGRITPAEADIGVMAFGLGELADALHEGERLPEIAESKRALDAVGVIAQLPIRSLLLEMERFIARQRRDAAATRRAGFFGKGLGHLACCNLTLKLMAGRESAIDLPPHDVQRAADRPAIGPPIPPPPKNHRPPMGEPQRPRPSFFCPG